MLLDLILVFVLILFAALAVWIGWEAYTAPLVDQDERVIDDPWGRMK